MIRVERSGVAVKGKGITILTEFATLVSVLLDVISEDLGEAEAKEIITNSFELGLKSEKELKDHAEELFFEKIKQSVSNNVQDDIEDLMKLLKDMKDVIDKRGENK